MKAELIRIGNSHGICIPKPIIEQCGFQGSVEMTVKDNTLVIAPARNIREGREEAFQAMAESGDDRLLDEETTASGWDEAEWE